MAKALSLAVFTFGLLLWALPGVCGTPTTWAANFSETAPDNALPVGTDDGGEVPIPNAPWSYWDHVKNWPVGVRIEYSQAFWVGFNNTEKPNFEKTGRFTITLNNPDGDLWYEASSPSGSVIPQPDPANRKNWIVTFAFSTQPGSEWFEFSNRTRDPTTGKQTAVYIGDISPARVNCTPTPELSSGTLLLVGALPLALAWRRRRKA
jgi:hypothetical protein